ncbi:CHAP domain-containing protein [Streptomyces sp. NRRL S-475]|uniref:CHAP domain-containing protein n=1 Tax=Streptomyces sp. NRRL S-475 TaxID=1463910 RepID=UPI0004C552C6|nr:CHAP domain-containing protein [Streptomyces sp. NRRL S-475]
MSLVDKIKAVAKGEVGTHEGRSGGHWNNDQKYSKEVPGLAWSNWQAWCATFVSWVAYKAGAETLYPRTASCAVGVAWFKNQGRFSEYPAVGAQVFYGPGGGSHTGLVMDYDDDWIYTVEGNTNDSGSAEGDGVYTKKRARRSDWVYGYGYPKFPEGIKSADPKYKAEAPKPAPKPVVDLSNVVEAARKDPSAAQGHTTHAADVKRVEAALKAEGLLPVKYAADGSFGTTTIEAYRKWQQKLGYSGKDADGIPGMSSLKKLGDKHGFTVKA